MDQHVESETIVNKRIDQEVTSSEQKTYRYAGFWMRFWAYIVDVIVVSSINGIVLSPFIALSDGAPFEIGFWTWTSIASGIVYYLYFLLMTKFFQQTLGKMVFGLKVIKVNEEKLLWSDLFFREIIGRLLHNIFAVLKLLYLVVAFSEEKQGIHDMIGKTRVVHT